MAEVRCAHCGTPAGASGQKFCEECGKPIDAGQQGPSGQDQQAKNAEEAAKKRHAEQQRRDQDKAKQERERTAQAAREREQRERERREKTKQEQERKNQERKAREDKKVQERREREKRAAEQRAAEDRKLRDEVAEDPDVRRLREQLEAAEQEATKRAEEKRKEEEEGQKRKEAAAQATAEKAAAEKRLEELRKQEERELREAEQRAKKLQEEQRTAEEELRKLQAEAERKEQEAAKTPSPGTSSSAGGRPPTEPPPPPEPPPPENKKRNWLLALVVLLAIGAIVAVAITMGNSGDDSNSDPTTGAAPAPTAASSAANTSSAQATTTVKTAGEPGMVSKPRLSSGSGDLQANWIAPNNNGSAINSYQVRLETLSGTHVVTKMTKRPGYTYRPSSIVANQKYRVTVRARNDSGWGPWSQTSGVGFSSSSTAAQATTTTRVRTTTTRATGVPGVTSRPALSNATGNLRADWSAPSNNGSAINMYQVRLETSSGTYVAANTTQSRYYTFRSLSNGQRYKVKVRARNNNGWGSWSLASSVVQYSSGTVTTTTKASQYTSGQETILLKKYSWLENSPQVKNLQRVLQITADGIYGPGTRKAHLAALTGAGLSTWGVPQAQSATTTTTGYTHPSKINKPSAGTPYLSGNEYVVVVGWDPPSQSGSSAVKTYVLECCNSTVYWELNGAYSQWTVQEVPGGRQSFRVRAINHENREGPWSSWSSSVWIPTAGATTTTTRPPATTTAPAGTYSYSSADRADLLDHCSAYSDDCKAMVTDATRVGHTRTCSPLQIRQWISSTYYALAWPSTIASECGPIYDSGGNSTYSYSSADRADLLDHCSAYSDDCKAMVTDATRVGHTRTCSPLQIRQWISSTYYALAWPSTIASECGPIYDSGGNSTYSYSSADRADLLDHCSAYSDDCKAMVTDATRVGHTRTCSPLQIRQWISSTYYALAWPSTIASECGPIYG